MNFNLVEIYNGLLRFNKHILNELAEGLKHLPNLEGASKGDSLYINEDGNPTWGSSAFIPTFENAAYGIEWTKNDNDVIRIGNAKFHRELPIQNRLKGCVYNEKKISYFLNPTGWAKPLENGFVPPLDGSDGDVGVNVPQFYICVKDTGTKYQLWISDFNIDGTFTRVHPFIISHTKTMTRTREDSKEEVFSACIKHDDTRYLGGNKSSSVAATKLQGRPRTGINYDKANEFCANRGDWITIIDYLEYCAIQALCYIEYANFDNQAALNINLTSEGFKQGGLGAGVTNLRLDRWITFNDNNPIIYTYWSSEHNVGNGSTITKEFAIAGYNTDGSYFNTYPAIYRGILNFFGDIWSFVRDVVIINKDADYNSVYLLKKGVAYADVTVDNVDEKCYFIGYQANASTHITEFDLQRGPYFVPNLVGTSKKFDYNYIRGNNGQDTDKSVRVLMVGGRADNGSSAGSGCFASGWLRSYSSTGVGFFTTVKLD